MAQAPRVSHAELRLVPGQSNGAGYFTITNSGDKADQITGIRSDCCDAVEMHEMVMDGDVMHMDKVDQVALPAGETVTFSPDGYHVMFIGLKLPPKSEDVIHATLTLRSGGAVDVAFMVHMVGSGHHDMHDMGDMHMGHE